MNSNNTNQDDRKNYPSPPVRPWLRLAVIVILLASLAGVVVYVKLRNVESGGQEYEVNGKEPDVRSQIFHESDQRSAVSSQTSGIASAASPANSPQTAGEPVGALVSGSPAALPQPTAQTRQLVSSLSLMDQAGRPMTAEEVTAWKHNLEQLVQQGATAVPAIVEFLKQNKDVDFDPDFSQASGYGSVRKAMFDALSQIGGQDAVSGTLQILQSTADPREIALLAQNLEKLAPEVYRQEAIRAAREALAMAADHKLEGSDVAPLFEVLHKFGDVNVVPDLEQGSKQWNYYSTMALAQLSDGAGIPALIQIAQNDASAKGNALEMLTQLSSQYPDARAALVDMVRANKIASNFWPYLTPLLAGDQYHYQDTPSESSLPTGKRTVSSSAYVVFGNQHFYTAPDLGSLTTEDINQRMLLIDEIQSVTTDPAASKALQQARDLLTKRTPQTVAVSP